SRSASPAERAGLHTDTLQNVRILRTFAAAEGATSLVTMSDLVERVREVLPSVRRDLEDLVRIESVWADPARRPEVRRSADAVAKLLSEAGFSDVQIVSEGGAPAVI